MPSCDVDITAVSLDGKVISMVDVESEGKTIFITVAVHKALEEWSQAQFGYVPVLSRVEDRTQTRGARLYLLFDSDTDAMLFKIHFAQSWIMALDDE